MITEAWHMDPGLFAGLQNGQGTVDFLRTLSRVGPRVRVGGGGLVRGGQRRGAVKGNSSPQSADRSQRTNELGDGGRLTVLIPSTYTVTVEKARGKGRLTRTDARSALMVEALLSLATRDFEIWALCSDCQTCST